MSNKKILFFIIISLSSCFDFSKSDFKDIGDGFDYGFYNGDRDNLLNVYYNDGGIFPSKYKCIKVEWNPSYIFATCEDRHTNHNEYFIIDKSKYISNPIQFGSKGLIGPLNYDSLSQTEFYKKNQLKSYEYAF